MSLLIKPSVVCCFVSNFVTKLVELSSSNLQLWIESVAEKRVEKEGGELLREGGCIIHEIAFTVSHSATE